MTQNCLLCWVPVTSAAARTLTMKMMGCNKLLTAEGKQAAAQASAKLDAIQWFSHRKSSQVTIVTTYQGCNRDVILNTVYSLCCSKSLVMRV